MSTIILNRCALEAILPVSMMADSSSGMAAPPSDVALVQPDANLASVRPASLLREILKRCNDYSRDTWLEHGSHEALALVEGAQRPLVRECVTLGC